MSDTPRTDEVFEASKSLPFGSVVEVPKGHPPCDPWDLARSLERENKALHICKDALDQIDDYFERRPINTTDRRIVHEILSDMSNKLRTIKRG